ncbi:MAG: cytochrome P460 family protein [Chromatiaceae bacterium]|nr:cytochrome P460 family protein [Chromatiaceae bacterium]MCP5315999.1 cytochrome P460 family protein [Chromatiaceae bacterium]
MPIHRFHYALLAASLCIPVAGGARAADVAPAPNGIEIPAGYKDWRAIGVSHRTDNQTLRLILGNDTAIAAARAGQTRPWPDGAILAKIVLKDAAHSHWPAATVPGRFVHAEFMLKDSAKYASTGGWGYARWIGEQQTPYGSDANFAQECHGCHTPMQDNDFVFTEPVPLP